jgi:o-succinylbenzoate synthase
MASITTWRVAPYAAELKHPLATGHGRQTTRQGCYVLARGRGERGAAAWGLGEAAPLPAWGTEDHTETARVLAALPAMAVTSTEQVPAALAFAGLELARHPAAHAAAELALLDLLAREAGVSLGQLLAHSGPLATEVAVNALIGAISPAQAGLLAGRLVTAGYSVFKLKLQGDAATDLQRVAAVRAAIGPKGILRLDANGQWSLADARARLSDLAPFAVAYIEQPTPATDIAALAELVRDGVVPIAADESVHAPGGLAAAIKAGVAAIVLKPMALGGLLATREALITARAAGIACILTSAIDRGVATAGILHLAAATPGLPAAGLDTAGMFADGGALAGMGAIAGKIRLAPGPGLGFTPQEPRLLEWLAR